MFVGGVLDPAIFLRHYPTWESVSRSFKVPISDDSISPNTDSLSYESIPHYQHDQHDQRGAPNSHGLYYGHDGYTPYVHHPIFLGIGAPHNPFHVPYPPLYPAWPPPRNEVEYSMHMQHAQIQGDMMPPDQLAAARKSGFSSDTNYIIEFSSDRFIERLFPPTRSPFQIDEKVFRALEHHNLWDRGRNCFHLPPDYSKPTICQWLNNIAIVLGNATGHAVKRRWSYGGKSGSDYTWELGLTLFDVDFIESNPRMNQCDLWRFIRAIGEVLFESEFSPSMFDKINANSFGIFSSQDDRRFVPALSFIGDGRFMFTLTDHEGQLRLNGGNLKESNRETAQTLLIILSFLMFGQLSDLGLDPHFIHNNNTGSVEAIMIDEKRFEIVEKIYSPEKLVGKGTKVWIVSHDDRHYILKDYWVQTDRVESEVDHLNKMLDHAEIKDYVPTLICGGDINIDGAKDWSGSYRVEFLGRQNARIHRRIVLSHVGEPITNFQSKKEFISVVIDIIYVLGILAEKLRILHHDVSINNVLLYRSKDNNKATGLLIDFDGSETVHNTMETLEDVADDSSASRHKRASRWMGTPPFMAIEALLAYEDSFEHKPRHDLESVLYVILYICTFTKGPSSPVTDADIPAETSVPLKLWLKKQYIREFGRSKIGHLETAHSSILPKFAPYWSDFTPFVEELIKTCFPMRASEPNALTHANMVSILQRAYLEVSEPLHGEPGRGTKRAGVFSSPESHKKGKIPNELSMELVLGA